MLTKTLEIKPEKCSFFTFLERAHRFTYEENRQSLQDAPKTALPSPQANPPRQQLCHIFFIHSTKDLEFLQIADMGFLIFSKCNILNYSRPFKLQNQVLREKERRNNKTIPSA